MLHCNMITELELQLALEDLLADLQFARKHNQLGRLAMLTSCETKAWAQRAGRQEIADEATNLFAVEALYSRDEFLGGIDALIDALKGCEKQYRVASPSLDWIGKLNRMAKNCMAKDFLAAQNL
jgi:hypothetical protein